MISSGNLFDHFAKIVILLWLFCFLLLPSESIAEDIFDSTEWITNGEQAESYFGCAVASAGDINGDAYDDIIIGAYGYDNAETGAGKAYVYYGASSGPGTIADWSAQGSFRYHSVGQSVATAGDVNNDGYDDVIVGAWNYDQVFVFYGSSSGLKETPDWTADFGADPREWFGYSVSTAGDVNNDGYDDIIIGMPGYGNGQSGEGRSLVFHGSADGLNATPNWTFEINQQDAHLGYSVSTAGDVNGDGYSDVIVGAYNQGPGEGYAHVFYGSASGLSLTPGWTAKSNIAGAYFGYSVSTAGDVNGDGYSDVIIGANGYNSGGLYNVGRAYVYHGSSSGLSATPNWTAQGSQQYAYFGSSVSTAGDINGDGFSDVIVGADGKGYGTLTGVIGRAYIYKGSSSGLSTSYDWTSSTGQPDDRYGFSVAKAGDVNGDKAGDVIVGTPNYSGSLTEAGRSYLYFGIPPVGNNIIIQGTTLLLLED